jgi:hypothetical protein
MSTQIDKAQALAEKITQKAHDAVAGVEREMAIMKWPAEFRAIMWHAIAVHANNKRVEADREHDGASR